MRQSTNFCTRLARSICVVSVFLMLRRAFSACSRLCLFTSTCWQIFSASSGCFDEVDLKLMLEELGHGLRTNLLVMAFFVWFS